MAGIIFMLTLTMFMISMDTMVCGTNENDEYVDYQGSYQESTVDDRQDYYVVKCLIIFKG